LPKRVDESAACQEFDHAGAKLRGLPHATEMRKHLLHP
jgi:hypothetical protein